MAETEVVMTTFISSHVKDKNRFFTGYEILVTGKFAVFSFIYIIKGIISLAQQTHVRQDIYFVSLSTSMHRMEENKTLIMAFNLEMIVSVRARVKLSNSTVPRHTLLYRGNKEKPALFKYKLLLAMNRAEWRKGICHIYVSLPHCLAAGI